jgi:hypothetical protein
MSVPLTKEVMRDRSAPTVHDPCRTRDSRGFGGRQAPRYGGCKGGQRVTARAKGASHENSTINVRRRLSSLWV